MEATLGDVIPLHQPLDERRLHEALREITDDNTTTVVLIATGPGYVGVRSFGPADQVKEAVATVAGLDRMHAALEQIANFAPEVTHGWADHVRQVAKHALRGD